MGVKRRREEGRNRRLTKRDESRYDIVLVANGNWLSIVVGRRRHEYEEDDDDCKEVRKYSRSLGYFKWGWTTFLSQLKIAYSVNLINNAMAPLRSLFLFSFPRW